MRQKSRICFYPYNVIKYLEKQIFYLASKTNLDLCYTHGELYNNLTNKEWVYMKKGSEFIVDAQDTLLPFLLKCFGGKSRNYAKGILKRGQVMVDGRVCTSFDRRLSPGQKVDIITEATVGIPKLAFPVLYEDDDIIVINKPAGMLAVATEKVREETAYHHVNEYVKMRSKFGRVFIVHRLDRETSGVMLFSKNEELKEALQENWDELITKREYIAVVEGVPEKRADTIISWLKQTKTLIVYSSNRQGDGKRAVTSYKTIKSSDNFALLDVSLDTGRKNQIRVHMKDIGHPIAGDKKYGSVTNPLGRLGLHASVLEVKHPFTEKVMRFEAPMPGTFEKAFK